MYSTIERKFANALKDGSLVFTETTTKPSTWNGLNTLYTLAPALAKKPSKADNNSSAGDKSKDPWNPPEESLFIEKGPTHSIVLNKFALVKYHFLVVTNEFQPQGKPLNEKDWTAAYKALRQANKESGKRHIGFYNCGDNSGASVAHKHIQFLTLPDGFKPFVDSVPVRPASKNLDVNVTSSEKVPFSHFISFIEMDASVEDIMVAFYELLNRTFTILSKHQASRSFNVVFTEEWIMVTPRKQEKAEGISINSLGTIGMMLAKNNEQLKTIEEKGFELFEELAFENEGAADFNDKVNTHIQY